MRIRNLAMAAAVATAAATGLTLQLAPTASAAEAKPNDFNGDGFGDHVVGTPNAFVGGKDKAGHVTVSYGSATGVRPSGSRTISQASAGVPGAAETADRFGADYATGDLDGDGYADLAVSAPGEVLDGTTNTGSVTVLWGGPNGLSYGGTSTTSPIDTSAPAHEHDLEFGAQVAIADMDGDGSAQLVSLTSARLYWYGDGFSRTDPSKAIEVTYGPYMEPWFSSFSDLTVGDYTKSGSASIIVTGNQECGEEGEDSCAWLGYAAGGPGGVEFTKDLAGEAHRGDASIVASGDLNKDGYADLVTGGQNSNSTGDASGAGRIQVRYGSANGPGAPVSFDQNTAGVPGTNEARDRFGAAVSVGDVTGDGYADVAVGVPGETVNGMAATGKIVLLKGSARGLTGTGAQAFHQATPGVPGAAEHDDEFGSDVRIGDINKDGKGDVTVSAAREDVVAGSKEDGADWVLRGSSSGLTASGATSFSAPDFGLTYVDRRFGNVLND
ncbi:FG-GAP repeat protein [Streptomyces sp. T-3]|nr:FG-GAP repeat protein [Streptomyces sp. T-3]